MLKSVRQRSDEVLERESERYTLIRRIDTLIGHIPWHEAIRQITDDVCKLG